MFQTQAFCHGGAVNKPMSPGTCDILHGNIIAQGRHFARLSEGKCEPQRNVPVCTKVPISKQRLIQTNTLMSSQLHYIITHAPVHINDFRGVRARYVKRTG